MNKSKAISLTGPVVFIIFYSFLGWGHRIPPVDDCTPIREEIFRIPPTGGTVEIPSGTYLCRTPIVLDRNHLRLVGQGKVIIRLDKNANAPVIVMGDIQTPPRPLRNIQVLNLEIDGNRWHQKYECWGGPCDQGGTTFIRNNGITVRGITNGFIQDVIVKSNRSGGIVTERGCFDLDIDNLVSQDNEFDGFAGYETFGTRLTRLNLSNNHAAGISLDIRFHGNLFRDVKIENNNDVGVFMRDSNFNTFENITLSNNGSHGIFLAKADNDSTCTIDNEFQNLSVSRSRGYGFLLNDSCEGNRLLGKVEFLENRDGCLYEPIPGQVAIEGKMLCID